MGRTALEGKVSAENPLVRFDEGKSASAKPRRLTLLCGKLAGILSLLFVCNTFATDFVVEYDETVTIDSAEDTALSGTITLKGGTLDLNGHDFTVTALNSTSPFSTIVNNGTRPATFTFDHAGSLSAKCNFMGGTGGLSVVKRGAGTLTLYGKVHCTAFTIEAGTVVSQPSTGVKGNALRWITWTTRPDATPKEGFNNGVQIREFALKRGGAKLSWPTGSSATVANSFNVGNAVANIISTSTGKFYDNAFANPVTITFGEEMGFETYDMMTAGDCIGRDPYSWTVEVGRTENGVMVWTPCGCVTEFACTTTRNTWMNGNFPVADWSPRFTGTAITVAAGATLELHHVDEPFAALTVNGTLVRDSNSPVTPMPSIAAGTTLRTLAASRAKVFRFTVLKSKSASGTKALQFSEFQVWLDGARVPWPAGTTISWGGGNPDGSQTPAKIIDGDTSTKFLTWGVLGAFTVTAPAPIAFNSYCWYTANDDHSDPVSWMLEVSDDGENWTLLDRVDDWACSSANRPKVGRMSEPLGTTLDACVRARYLKFEITSLRSNLINEMQFAEFEVLTNGVKVAWPNYTHLGWSQTRSKNSGSAKTEPPDSVIDGDHATKFYTSLSGLGAIMIYCPDGIAFDAYRWVTAGDADSRDPTGWKLSVSLDGSHWRELDTVTGYNTTSMRNAIAYTSPKLVGTIDVLPNDAVATLDASTLSLGGPETIGGLAGTGTLEVWGETTLDVAAGATESFNGTMTGRGALVKAGAGVQVLEGAVALEGRLVVKEGELRLDEATLPAGLVIVLEGGKLTGTATCAGNLTVESRGGAYGATIALEGTLALTGTLKLAPDAGYVTHRVCFEYESADDASQALFLSAPCSEELPSKYMTKTAIVGKQMVFSIYPASTLIYIR